MNLYIAASHRLRILACVIMERPNGKGGVRPAERYDDGHPSLWRPTTEELNIKNHCPKCGATRVDKQLGLEATPEEFLANMVEVFREARRVLRADGTCWVNMGDSFQEKQLIGMPWRLALALQADGWWLRSDIIWAKPNPMPESVTDRPTKAHEYVFLFSKSARYFYDNEAVRENKDALPDIRQRASTFKKAGEVGGHHNGAETISTTGRNRRSVWRIATQPFSAAHFATFPTKLVEPMIRAGTSERGCCPECGAPWERVVRKTGKSIPVSERHGRTGHNGQPPQISGMYWDGPTTEATNEWQPSCDCKQTKLHKGEQVRIEYEPVPCIAIDPFAGACTVGLVADRLGRDSIMIELNPEYAEMGRKRIEDDAGWVADIVVEETPATQGRLL
jgi:DNA modification methylase